MTSKGEHVVEFRTHGTPPGTQAQPRRFRDVNSRQDECPRTKTMVGRKRFAAITTDEFVQPRRQPWATGRRGSSASVTQGSRQTSSVGTTENQSPAVYLEPIISRCYPSQMPTRSRSVACATALGH